MLPPYFTLYGCICKKLKLKAYLPLFPAWNLKIKLMIFHIFENVIWSWIVFKYFLELKIDFKMFNQIQFYPSFLGFIML